jgi:hypothetical protein
MNFESWTENMNIIIIVGSRIIKESALDITKRYNGFY